MITSQNHGFAVDETSLPRNLRVTHRLLFDGTVQGIARTDKPAFSFQGHPEASPGPHDVASLFDKFIAMMEAASSKWQVARKENDRGFMTCYLKLCYLLLPLCLSALTSKAS